LGFVWEAEKRRGERTRKPDAPQRIAPAPVLEARARVMASAAG
jgi:hypothetical protein